MKMIFKTVLLLFQMQELISQAVCESNHLSSKAEIYYRQKTDLQTAIEYYKESFRLKVTDGSKVLDALNAATLLNDTLSVIHFLITSVSIGISPSDIQQLWSRIGSGMDFDYLIDQIDTTTIIEQYNSLLDTSLIKQLKCMAENDQKYRGNEELEYELQKSLDSLNWVELKQIVQQLGRMPYFKELGFEGQENLEILFFHMNKGIIEWFLPYIRQSVMEDNSNLSTTILYQLDRVGMSEGVIYTITEDWKIEIFSDRTRMKNGFFCQSFGEWLYEKSLIDNKIYETPIDPRIGIDEINKIRGMFCLDRIEEKRLRRPWVKVVSISEFEHLIIE
jgi:hypothetical protein